MQRNRLWRGATLVVAVASALLAGAAPASAAPSEGSAYALNLTAPIVGALGPIAPSSSGGPTSNSLVSLPVSGIGSVGALETSAVADGEAGTVDAMARTANVQLSGNVSNLLGGAIVAEAITAECHSTTDGITGSATLLGLTIGGDTTVPVDVAPNYTINLGVGKITLNEQLRAPDGTLTVNALHAQALGIDVVISSATCGVPCPPIPLASGAGMWLAFGVLAAAGVPIGGRFLRHRRTTQAQR